MDIEKLKDRICKLKAMKARGEGGERDAADRLLRNLSAKYGIAIDGIGSEVERRRDLKFKHKWENEIFTQLLGLMRIEQSGGGHVERLRMFYKVGLLPKTNKRSYYTFCTDAQWIELNAKFAVLCTDYKRHLDSFTLAFLMANDLLLPREAGSPKMSAAEKHEYALAEQVSHGIVGSSLARQLEAKDLP